MGGGYAQNLPTRKKKTLAVAEAEKLVARKIAEKTKEIVFRCKFFPDEEISQVRIIGFSIKPRRRKCFWVRIFSFFFFLFDFTICAGKSEKAGAN